LLIPHGHVDAQITKRTQATTVRSPLLDSLAAGRRRWARARIREYQIQTHAECFCPRNPRDTTFRHSLLTIRDGQIIARAAGSPRPNLLAWSVDSLFGRLERDLREQSPDAIQVELDPRYGFPRKYHFSGTRLPDTWATFLVDTFVVLKSFSTAPLPASDNRIAVEVYVTTSDRTKLLSREPDSSFGDPEQGIATIAVDETRSYQSMVGFGAALTDASAWLIQNSLTLRQRETLLRELFGPEPGVGFSFVRIDMGASDFSLRHYSYDDMPPGKRDPSLARFSIDRDRKETIPILKRALALNPRLAIMASPWSAPGWMKTTGSLVKGTLRPEAYGPFSEYFKRFIQAYAAEGIPLFAITVQNEPHFEPENYPGMRLDPAARAKFVGEYLGPLLARSRIATRILDWDHNWDEPNSPLTMLADPTARRFVSGVAWHCYGGDVSAQSKVRDAYPDKDVFFTECSGGDWAPKFADNLAWTVRNLVIGATRNWARGVLMWNLALDERHGPHLGGCGNCRGVVTINSSDHRITRNEEYYALAHASRFVRPGARRIESDTGVEGIESVAFRNADGSKVLVVLNTNALEKAFAIRASSRTLRYSLPAGAVATFRWN
jgi:glucosylceramidase